MDPMSLVTPSIGLMFWTCVVFVTLVLILKRFAWKPILNSVEERNNSIEQALQSAEKAKQEMATLQSDNEKILQEARTERDAMLKEARDLKNEIINEAKKQANEEADKILISTKDQINNEKMKALVELKNQVANLSIEMAEKILKSELQDKNKQKELIEQSIKSLDLN
tara:strand:- start:3130 stop:3633 length:504 start_codon:yes stop_codon:yes gene_type:complete